MRLKSESKIVLISGAEKVVDLEAQKLEKRTFGTSKTSQIHWRGCDFQLVALFSDDSLFESFSALWGIILGSFWDTFSHQLRTIRMTQK